MGIKKDMMKIKKDSTGFGKKEKNKEWMKKVGLNCGGNRLHGCLFNSFTPIQFLSIPQFRME